MNTPPVILSIAGSDPSGGAGIQADIKTVSALGGYAAAALTAVTVQNTRGVAQVEYLPADTVGRQCDAVIEDLAPAAVKIGMTGTPAILHAIAEVLERHGCGNIVFDPVALATSGRMLTQADALEAACDRLLPRCTLVTPNLSETALLTGETVADIEGTARRIDTSNLHGTGCTLSSAIATLLGKGLPLREAVGEAKAYVTRAIEAARPLRIGHGNGPLWHFPEPEHDDR